MRTASLHVDAARLAEHHARRSLARADARSGGAMSAGESPPVATW